MSVNATSTATALRIAALCGALAIAGCAATEPASPGLELRFADIEGGCQKTTNGANTVPDDIATLVAVLHTPDGNTQTFSATRASVASTGAWLIKGIKALDSVDVEIYGCDAGGGVVYAGRSNGTQVVDQQETTVRAFLVPVGKVSCTGDSGLSSGDGATTVPDESAALPQQTALGAAAPLANGDVFVSGGLGTWTKSAQQGLATRETAVYDHQTGHFRRGPRLRDARVWHHAVPVAPNKVLVVGGLTSVNTLGQKSGVPTPVLVPNDLGKAIPADKAELVDLSPDSNGQPRASVVSTSDVGVGANPLSSVVVVGDSALFVGGVDTSGAAVASATRLAALSQVGSGAAGTTTAVTMAVARIRPGLVALDDGRVVVWGGNSSGKADDLGEILDKDSAKSKKLKITGDDGLLKQAMLATAGPTVALLGQTGATATLLVTGGMPFSKPTDASGAPSYLVLLDRSTGTATLKPLTVAGETLYGGLGGATTTLADGRVIVAGGLVAVSAAQPCDAGAAECLLSQVWVFDANPDTSAATVDLKPSAKLDLGAGQLGVLAAPLPMGALLAGGLTAVVGDAPEGALTRTARVVVGTPAASVCTP